jgi:hypothetical protein
MPWIAIDDAIPKPSMTTTVTTEQARGHPRCATA